MANKSKQKMNLESKLIHQKLYIQAEILMVLPQLFS